MSEKSDWTNDDEDFNEADWRDVEPLGQKELTPEIVPIAYSVECKQQWLLSGRCPCDGVFQTSNPGSGSV